MKHKLQFSIRLKLTLMLLIFTSGICLVFILMNRFFMKDYYVSNKKENLVRAYEEIDKIVEKSDTLYEYDTSKIITVCEKYGASLIVVDTSDSVQFLYGNGNALRYRLRDISFGIHPDDYKILKKTSGYTLASINLDNTKSESGAYLELSGFFDQDKLFLFRMSVENITESVSVSLNFFAQISIMVLFIGIIVAFFVSRWFSKPIMKLAKISKEMSNLNFNIKYDGHSDDEIGVLGNAMNELSDKLETTIIELKQANSDLKKDIEKKEEIDEMRKEFISNVSHELKTPIALIQGYAEGLNECINDDAESREFYCSVIIDEADKMNKMVKSLLSLTKLEFGNSDMEYEKFDLNMVISGVISSLGYMVEQYGVSVEYHQESPIFVYADEFKIEEVITNYLTNAIHYALGEKRVEVTITPLEKKVRVTVFNTGNQIPEESLEQVWVKFYKVDKARTREYGGSGIGLAIVQAIMKAHGNVYGVQNREDGVEFYFELDTELI